MRHRKPDTCPFFLITLEPNFAEHDEAAPRAGSPERDPSRSEAERGSNQKPHRFDKFALRMAEGMITAIRVTLGVFSSPDKERWPFARLLDHLKGAESLARDMLREIAAKISVSPAKFRKRSKQGQVTLGVKPADCTPYFRLGVKPAEPDSPEGEELEACASPSRMREGDRGGGHQNAATAPLPWPLFREPGEGDARRRYHLWIAASRPSRMCSPIPASMPRAWPGRCIVPNMRAAAA